MFMGEGEEKFIDAEHRSAILEKIADYRNKEADLSVRVASLPAGEKVPFQGDQGAFQVAANNHTASSTIVAALDTRLRNEPGPFWKNLSPQEENALAVWTGSIDRMTSIVSQYFPTAVEKDWGRWVLLAIAAGTILGPIFFTKGDERPLFSFTPKPPPLPPWITGGGSRVGPAELPVPSGSIYRPAPSTALTPAPQGAAMAPLPPVFGRSGALALPMPGSPSAAAPIGPPGGFARRFTQPLGPTPGSSPPAATPMPGGIVFPRYRVAGRKK